MTAPKPCRCPAHKFPHRYSRKHCAEPAISDAERYLGREVYAETRKADLREIRRIANRIGDKWES